MAAKPYRLDYRGYWRDAGKDRLPADSGVYSVYACTYDPRCNTVSLHALIYIGQSDNIRERVGHHERLDDWKMHLESGDELCYSYASVAADADLDRVEAALIFEHEPPENSDYRDNFPFDTTTVITGGENEFLEPEFTVWTTS